MAGFSDDHSTMVRDLYLSIEKRLNRKLKDSPEYDVQQMVSDFYQDWFRNTAWRVERERAGKVDIVLFESDKEKVYYEIKTFFKANEKITRNAIIDDVNKLASRVENGDNSTRAFMLLAGRKSKLNISSLPKMVELHMDNDRHNLEVSKDPRVVLRPSRKEAGQGIAFVMTWEVLATKERN
jgi:hypothetical protein